MSSYKRALFVGCSHAKYVDPFAKAGVLAMIKAYKPHAVVHLGDFCDTAAFRSGAHGSSDESEPVDADIDTGLAFLQEIGATHVFLGNHEDRLYRMRESPNAVVAYAANQAINAIEDQCRKLKARLIPYDGAFQGMMFGNYLAMHGYMFGEQATRDHAEAHGNIIHAHTHRAAMATGRRADSPTGLCVGTLTKRGEMGYAKARRATLAWRSGFVFGEYNDRIGHFWLHAQPINCDEWRLPV
jgi:hypothetical protein